MKGYLHASHPDIHYLMSRSNVDYQYDGFEELGARLADEVASYLENVHGKVDAEVFAKLLPDEEPGAISLKKDALFCAKAAEDSLRQVGEK